jgi:hypothetical protein
MNLRDFYKCQYELEITRKTDLTASLSIPLGVVSLLAGALALMAKSLNAPLTAWDWVTLGFICLATVACILVGFFLYRAHSAFEYAYLPTSMELDTFYKGLLTFNKEVGHDDKAAEETAEQDTLAYIDEQYKSNASINAENNHRKSGYQYISNKALMFAVVLTSTTGILYIVNSIWGPTAVQRVEIVNFKDGFTLGNSTTTEPPTNPSGPSGPSDAAPKQADPGGLPATSIAPPEAPQVDPQMPKKDSVLKPKESPVAPWIVKDQS